MTNNARIYTNHLIGMAQDGVISWMDLAVACLGSMSEADAKSLAEDDYEVYDLEGGDDE
jgi:hypothetical protein